MGTLHTVARTTDIPPGGSKGVEVGGAQVALFNVGGTYFALEDNCPHSGAPLSEGDIEDDTVVCPWHGATFRLCDGSVLCPPAEEAVACFRVVVEGDEIKIELP